MVMVLVMMLVMVIAAAAPDDRPQWAGRWLSQQVVAGGRAKGEQGFVTMMVVVILAMTIVAAMVVDMVVGNMVRHQDLYLVVADRTAGEDSQNSDPYWEADTLVRNIEDLKKELPQFPASTQFLA